MSSIQPPDMDKGGQPASLRQQAADHLWMPYSSPGRQGADLEEIHVIARGRGVKLWDDRGREYLDGVSALEAAILGHGDEEIIEAITAQARELTFLDVFRYAAPVQIELAAELARLSPGMQYAHFAPGGAEAVEISMKLARQYHLLNGEPHRMKVLTRQGSFHGVTGGAMSLDGNYFASKNYQYDGGLNWGRIVPVGHSADPDLGRAGRHLPSVADIEATLRAEGPETVAAVVVDPMATAMAVGAPPDQYQRDLRAVCDRYGVLLVCDEVIAGMGRTGRMFATEHSGIQADFITVSKGLSAGYIPIAACLISPKIADLFKEHKAVFRHGHTYAGHPLGAAAALATIKRLQRDRLWENAEAMGTRLLQGLSAFADNPLFWDARGRGLLAGLEIVADGATGEDFPNPGAAGNEFRRRCRDKGLIVIVLHPGNVILLAPPLTVTSEEIDAMLAILREVLDEMAAAHGPRSGSTRAEERGH